MLTDNETPKKEYFDMAILKYDASCRYIKVLSPHFGFGTLIHYYQTPIMKRLISLSILGYMRIFIRINTIHQILMEQVTHFVSLRDYITTTLPHTVAIRSPLPETSR